MKFLYLITGICLLTTFTACNKEIVKVEILKDCTGSYIRLKNGQDLKVCNSESLDPYATGTKLKVSYDKLEQCFGLVEEPICEMAHSFEGVIEITKIQ